MSAGHQQELLVLAFWRPEGIVNLVHMETGNGYLNDFIHNQAPQSQQYEYV